MQAYFEKEYVTVSYSRTAGAIVIDWKMRPFSSEFRAALNVTLAAMENFKTGKIIADSRHLGTLAVEDQDWVVNEWTVSALERGNYSHIAIIVPSDVYDKMAIDDVIAQVEGNVRVGYFDDPERAIEWMSSLKSLVNSD